MKRILSLLLVVILCLSIFTGCGNTSEKSTVNKVDNEVQNNEEVAVFRYAEGGSISNLEPYNYSGTVTSGILCHMFNSLTRTDADGNIVGDLAESFEPIDENTWEFKLKKNVKFHNGENFDASVVKYSIERATNKDLNWRLGSDFGFIKEVQVIDDYTVRIITKDPYYDTLLRMGALLMVPPKYVEEVGHENFGKQPVGTGPYKFVEWIKDERLVMEAFEGYFEGPSKIKKVVFKTIPEDATRIAALEAGEIDLISNVPISQIERLKNNPDIEVALKPTIRVIFVGMNTLNEGPLQDKRVRQALNYAVDVNSIIKNILNSGTNRVATIIAQEYFGYSDDIKPYEHNIEKAKQLLKEAGYENGLTLDFAVNAGRQMNNREISQVIANQLSKAGITVNIVEKENGLFTSDLKSKKIEDLYFMGIGGKYASSELISRISFSTDQRYSTYSNKEFDELRTKAGSTVKEEDAKELWKQLQELVKEEAPAIFLYQEPSIYAYNKKVKNFKPRMDQMVSEYGAYIEE